MTKRHDVLCQCGWGQMGMLETAIPDNCPMCGFDFMQHGMLSQVECDHDPEDDAPFWDLSSEME